MEERKQGICVQRSLEVRERGSECAEELVRNKTEDTQKVSSMAGESACPLDRCGWRKPQAKVAAGALSFPTDASSEVCFCKACLTAPRMHPDTAVKLNNMLIARFTGGNEKK